ncbi:MULTISPECIES: SRPBCC family protein [unclassified Streptomyces]|uniref:SRPBCC family protein n=1 Tax=unclassified Streptomyces TaxID=2593676 RepID=UPI00278C0B77|nr:MULTISPECIES: SRPBCC family protein [unclassified Streptomyces]
MKLENTLGIPLPVDAAWQALLDVERVAPCVPGATLTSSDGDTHQGRIKVKLGPIGLVYHGTVTFLSRDEEAKVVVLEAGGRESRGNGTAKAVVTCRLSAAGRDRTDIHVHTELTITGRPAQFGRATLGEVSAALMDRFAQNLSAELSAGSAAPATPAATAPLDLVEATAAGDAALKRAVPVALALGALLVLAFARRRHR